LLCVCCIVGIFANKFFSPNNLLNIFRQVATSAIVAVGFTLVIAAGQLDLSVGYMVGLIVVVSAMLAQHELPFPVILFICVCIGLLCGFINALWNVWLGIPLIISTLAMGNVYKGVNYLLCNNKSIANLTKGLSWFGSGRVGSVPIPMVVLVCVALITWIVVNRLKFGRHTLALGGNREAAKVSGININKVTLGIFMLTGACVAVAAMVLTGRSGAAQPTAGQGMEMDAIAAVVIGGTPLTGGKAKIIGTLFGCLLVGVINNGLNLLQVSINWQIIAKGLMILGAVLIDTQMSRLLARQVIQQAKKA
jgi:ribose transport system permease protein